MTRAIIPKLIIVDGLSGSGKTSTCRWLEQQLCQRGLATRAFYEAHVPHPLHWWDYWDGTRHQGPDFDRVASSTYMDASIEKWNQFIGQISASEDIVVIEAALYGLAVWLFLQGDTPSQQIAGYIQRVEAIIAPVAPLLIYLRQDHVAEHTRKVWSSRDSSIEQELIGNMERTRYFRSRQLRGFEGVIALWQDTQALTDELFAKHQIDKLAIEITAGDWASYYQQIHNCVFQASNAGCLHAIPDSS